MSTPRLRPYQQQFIRDVYAQIRAGKKRILGWAATGSGKTLISAQIIAHAVAKAKRTYFIVHRDELISQSHDKLCSFGLEASCGFIKSGRREDRSALVQLASVQSLAKRKWWCDDNADIVVLDEAHLTAFAAPVRQMLDSTFPNAIYLGLTATPYRLSKKESLGDIFSALVCAPLPRDLIDLGFLIKPSYVPISRDDFSAIGRKIDGDFDERQLALACDRPESIQQTVAAWMKYARERRTIGFTVNISHAKHLAEAFQASGIQADYIDGSTKNPTKIYQKLADGEILALFSCMKLVEGFDCPAVSAVILDRPTMSKALHFQMIGRGLRLCNEIDKRDAVIIDRVGNLWRHGTVEEIRLFDLKSKSEATSEVHVPKKLCPIENGGCGSLLYGFQQKCSECGYLFPSAKKQYFTPNSELLLATEEERSRYEFYRSKLREAHTNKYSPGWAANVFKERYGHWPPYLWGRGAIFSDRPTRSAMLSYYEHLQQIARNKNESEAWLQKYMELEFELN